MIKAINTRYKGYNFRSRTEARWAVFFDELGWEWQYEAEGYHLPSGQYLPDFYFPGFNMYAEIKGKAFTTQETLKCKELSEQTYELCGGTYPVIVLMLDGPPAERCYISYRDGEESCPSVMIPGTDSKYGPLYYGDGESFFGNLRKAIEKALSARFEFGENYKKLPKPVEKTKAIPTNKVYDEMVIEATKINRNLGYTWNGDRKLTQQEIDNYESI